MSTFFKSAAAFAAVSIGGLKALEQWHGYNSARVSKSWPTENYIASSENSLCLYRLGPLSANRKVILLHGIGHSSVSMAGIGKAIYEATGDTVIRYDRPGYGSSRFLSPEPRSLQQFVTELVEILDYSTSPDDEILIVGHSLGGLIARLAQDDSITRTQLSVVLLDPTHPHEAATERGNRLGMVLAGQELERRSFLSTFGGELFDASIGKLLPSANIDHYENATHQERFTSRCAHATRRESAAVFGFLLNGKYTNAPDSRHDVFVIASAKSDDMPNSRSLLKTYVNADDKYHVIKGTDHESMLHDPDTTKQVLDIINRERSHS